MTMAVLFRHCIFCFIPITHCKNQIESSPLFLNKEAVIHNKRIPHGIFSFEEVSRCWKVMYHFILVTVDPERRIRLYMKILVFITYEVHKTASLCENLWLSGTGFYRYLLEIQSMYMLDFFVQELTKTDRKWQADAGISEQFKSFNLRVSGNTVKRICVWIFRFQRKEKQWLCVDQ